MGMGHGCMAGCRYPRRLLSSSADNPTCQCYVQHNGMTVMAQTTVTDFVLLGSSTSSDKLTAYATTAVTFES